MTLESCATVTPTHINLRALLQNHSLNVALQLGDNKTISYAQLLASADTFALALGDTRRLVFLEACPTPEIVAAYLACLIARHPVHLLPPGGGRSSDALIATYRPNLLVSGASARLDWLHGEPVALHPDLALLLSTSGTTGSPRFVKLSLQNLLSNARSIIEYLGIDSGHVTLLSLPLSYSYGLSVLNSHLLAGASLGLTDASPLSGQFWALFDRLEASSFAGVPYVFEALRQDKFQFGDHPSLRYVTQAGGKLSSEMVRHLAAAARQEGWRFFVMYGQTEASPRIAYLPPHLAESFPHCIGIAVPGGELSLLDAKGEAIAAADVEGELAYSGPNVMMGYATARGELSTDETPPLLKTGDLGRRNSEGLYYVTGRSKRIVKPFGFRISLDALEADLKEIATGIACFGDDERVVVAVPVEHRDRVEDLMAQMAGSYKLPRSTFSFMIVPELPRLDTGKPDYGALQRTYAAHQQPQERGLRERLRLAAAVLSPLPFLSQTIAEALALAGIRSASWQGIAEIYARILAVPHVSSAASFDSLAGDSLSYVQASIAIEEYLGAPPPAHWDGMTVRDLEELALKRC